MTELQSKRFVEILEESVASCASSNIALSGGLDSSVIARCLREKGRRPDAYAVIAEDFVARDLTYCQMIASDLDIPLSMIKVNTGDIISAIGETIKILGNFNDIEIRNSVVMYIALRAIKDRGQSSIITGDGADELFAGYDFLLRKPDADLERDLDRIYRIMHFPSKKIGESLGITVETPFLSQNMREFSKDIPVGDKIGVHDGTKFGKWIVRKSFEGKIPSQIVWRRKTPMQDGSGTASLTNLFDAVITDQAFDEKRRRIESEDGVTIRTKESLHYYQTFRGHFGLPGGGGGGRRQHGVDGACPDCGCGVENGSRFCRMCGRFPV